MKILQICDYAAKYRGNFIESLEYFRKTASATAILCSMRFPKEWQSAAISGSST